MVRHFERQYQASAMATRVLDLELRSMATNHFLMAMCKINMLHKILGLGLLFTLPVVGATSMQLDVDDQKVGVLAKPHQ